MVDLTGLRLISIYQAEVHPTPGTEVLEEALDSFTKRRLLPWASQHGLSSKIPKYQMIEQLADCMAFNIDNIPSEVWRKLDDLEPYMFRCERCSEEFAMLQNPTKRLSGSNTRSGLEADAQQALDLSYPPPEARKASEPAGSMNIKREAEDPMMNQATKSLRDSLASAPKAAGQAKDDVGDAGVRLLRRIADVQVSAMDIITKAASREDVAPA